MRRLASTNVLVLFLVVITTIDASRIFYFPLLKIHSSHHHELDSSPSVQESTKQRIHEENIRSDEFIPISAMERNMYDDNERRGEEENNQSNIYFCCFFVVHRVLHHR